MLLDLALNYAGLVATSIQLTPQQEPFATVFRLLPTLLMQLFHGIGMVFHQANQSRTVLLQPFILSLEQLDGGDSDLFLEAVLKLGHEYLDPRLAYLYLLVRFTHHMGNASVQLGHLHHTVLQILLHPRDGIMLSEEVVLQLLELGVVRILHSFHLIAKIFYGLFELHDELLFLLVLGQCSLLLTLIGCHVHLPCIHGNTDILHLE